MQVVVRPGAWSDLEDQGDLMGFNATRRYRDGKTSDIVLLIAATVVIAGLLLWGFGVL